MSETTRMTSVPNAGLHKKLVAQLMKYTSDFNYVLDHIDELKIKHPNNYIAVRAGRVEYSNKNFDKVVNQIKKDGLDLNAFVIEFIPTGKRKFLF